VKICGVQGVSLIDYPGRIAAVLFLGGCNFRCPFCQNADLVLRPDELPALAQDGVVESLLHRRSLLDGVVVTGGEPLIHGDGLFALLARLHAAGFAVKLDTNGYETDALRDVLGSGLVDYVAMDVKTSLPKYEQAAGRPIERERIVSAVDAIRGSGVAHEFRTTCVPVLVERDDVVAVATMLGPGERYYLQQFRTGDKVLDPAWAAVTPHTPSVLRSFAGAASGLVALVSLRSC
jgi:pyruvate formate lyase activating enzyme